MAKTFTVIVTDARGKVKIKKATIGGGIERDADWLANHYQELNVFPGAKSIEIHESTETVPSNVQSLIKAIGVAATPKPTIVKKPEPTTPAAVVRKAQ